ncbi:MAG: hypothetical protein AAFX05_11370, partial [Planctomycetota bacterium]
MSRIIGRLAVLCAAVAVGCSSSGPERESYERPRGMVVEQLGAGGDAELLGDVGRIALSPGALRERVRVLTSQQRLRTAATLVRGYPDVTLELLRSCNDGCGSDPAVRFISRLHDIQCMPQDADTVQAWDSVLAVRNDAPSRFDAFDEQRIKFLNMSRSGDFAGAANIRMETTVVESDPPLLRAEAWRLRGTGFFLLNDHAAAAEAFARARAAAADHSTYFNAKLALLESESRRRAGQREEAIAVWLEALRLAADLATRQHPVRDPVLWEHAIEVRPGTTPWPGFLGTALPTPIAASVTEETSASAESAVWALIGQWRLERAEGESALIALKRSEALVQDARAVGTLRHLQAKALMQLDQADAATVILMDLAGRDDTVIAAKARGTFGTLQIGLGRYQEGAQLLDAAVRLGQVEPWDELNQTRADLALALLMLGLEEQGLEQLHTAQAAFAEYGQVDELIR